MNKIWRRGDSTILFPSKLPVFYDALAYLELPLNIVGITSVNIIRVYGVVVSVACRFEESFTTNVSITLDDGTYFQKFKLSYILD